MQHVSELLPAIASSRQIKGLSRIQQRLIDTARQESLQSLLYLHSVLCQTCLPYRNPGDEVRTWERLNGNVHLKVLAGEMMHPNLGRLVSLGLPYGPKARMIWMHINQQALRQQSQEIEIENTLTKFVSELLKLAPHGRNLRAVKDQLARLVASSVRLGIVKDGHAVTVNSYIVSAFDIWFPKDERQRVLWPSTIRLSTEYWESLKTHAVPLPEEHILALSHNAMALDIYAWLAHRLHRISGNRPVAISWVALRAQFGQGYGQVRDFRRAFKIALKEVLSQYRKARIDVPEENERYLTPEGLIRSQLAKGITLYCSPPPVSHRVIG